MLTQAHHLNQIYNGPKSVMLHTMFCRNRHPVSWKEDFFTIYEHGSHIGHVTSITLINFYFIVPKSLYINLVENNSVVSEERKFLFS